MSRIPKILHYTFGLAKDFGGKPWSMLHHVCLESAVRRIAPDQVFFYHEYEPSGPWWELSRKLVSPVKIEAPREIFGRPLNHVAHRADVVRLQKLAQVGGIYLDADVLVQRSFDDLLNESTVLGREGVGDDPRMANAIILAEPNAPFIMRWIDQYHSFRSTGRDEFWNEHSVLLPARLAQENPQDITVLDHKAFFWPLWTPEHIRWIFDSNDPISLEGVYANHLWESEAWPFIKGVTVATLRARETNFSRWARPMLEGLPDSYGAASMSERWTQARWDLLHKAKRARAMVTRRLAGK
ncbi:MAG: glycosyltransferase family 32 protein [Janthinobacterium lividum]